MNETEKVYLLFSKAGTVEGVYRDVDDARADADYLGKGWTVEEWSVDETTVVVYDD